MRLATEKGHVHQQIRKSPLFFRHIQAHEGGKKREFSGVGAGAELGTPSLISFFYFFLFFFVVALFSLARGVTIALAYELARSGMRNGFRKLRIAFSFSL